MSLSITEDQYPSEFSIECPVNGSPEDYPQRFISNFIFYNALDATSLKPINYVQPSSKYPLIGDALINPIPNFAHPDSSEAVKPQIHVKLGQVIEWSVEENYLHQLFFWIKTDCGWYCLCNSPHPAYLEVHRHLLLSTIFASAITKYCTDNKRKCLNEQYYDILPGVLKSTKNFTSSKRPLTEASLLRVFDLAIRWTLMFEDWIRKTPFCKSLRTKGRRFLEFNSFWIKEKHDYSDVEAKYFAGSKIHYSTIEDYEAIATFWSQRSRNIRLNCQNQTEDKNMFEIGKRTSKIINMHALMKAGKFFGAPIESRYSILDASFSECQYQSKGFSRRQQRIRLNSVRSGSYLSNNCVNRRILVKPQNVVFPLSKSLLNAPALIPSITPVFFSAVLPGKGAESGAGLFSWACGPPAQDSQGVFHVLPPTCSRTSTNLLPALDQTSLYSILSSSSVNSFESEVESDNSLNDAPGCMLLGVDSRLDTETNSSDLNNPVVSSPPQGTPSSQDEKRPKKKQKAEAVVSFEIPYDERELSLPTFDTTPSTLVLQEGLPHQLLEHRCHICGELLSETTFQFHLNQHLTENSFSLTRQETTIIQEHSISQMIRMRNGIEVLEEFSKQLL